MELEPKSKFSFPAEVLPQNPRTQEIMAQREAKENQRRAEEEEVSHQPSSFHIHALNFEQQDYNRSIR